MFRENKIDEFIGNLSSESPSPGGGTVAALLGALSASLCSMMANLTVDKKSYEKEWQASKDIANRMSIRIKDFYDLMDKDANSFNGVIEALNLPKETKEEKEIRSKKIQEGYLDAIKAPIDIADDCLKLFEDIEYIVKRGNKNVVTDGIAAAICASCAINIALLNVKINIKSIKDEEYVKMMNEKVNELEIFTARRLAEIKTKANL